MFGIRQKTLGNSKMKIWNLECSYCQKLEGFAQTF
jgi:hypothetical protein